MRISKMWKRGIAAILFAVLLLGFFPAHAFAKPSWPVCPVIASESGIVIDVDSGTMLYGQNVHQQQAPASITKLLTALVVLEHCDLDETVTYSHDAVYDVEAGSGNKYHLEEGDTLTVEDCLYLLLLASSNQTANALAEHTAGSISAFADMMNQKCGELGCSESHFANPSGLNDPSQLTSAWDMALIARAAMENEELLKIDSTESYDIPATKNNPNGVTITMEHKLIVTDDPSDPNYYPYAVAGKTGYTMAAGQTLVTYAVKDDRREIAVTMKSTQRTHYSDTKTLLEFGFNNFKNVSVAENLSLPDGASVTFGDKKYDRSDLVLEDAVITLPNDAEYSDAEMTLVTENLPADMPAGTVAVYEYTYDDRMIGVAPVISKKAAEQEQNTVVKIAGKEETEETSSGSSGFFGFLDNLRMKAARGFDVLYEAVTGFAAALRSWYLSLHLTRVETLGIIGAACAGILILIFVIRRVLQKRSEKAYLAASKERRKQRLTESGVSEEDFAKLVDEVKKRGNKDKPDDL